MHHRDWYYGGTATSDPSQSFSFMRWGARKASKDDGNEIYDATTAAVRNRRETDGIEIGFMVCLD
jgi:hypothetical protein